MEKKELLDSMCYRNFTLVSLPLDSTANLSKNLPWLMICI